MLSDNGILRSYEGISEVKMSKQRVADELLNISVQGKKYTVKRSVLCMDTKSKLYEWFKPNSSKPLSQDKSGNQFLDLDGKSFHCIINYLRYKREKLPLTLALPAKPDDLSTLMADAETLKMDELSELCSEMLQRYQREESTFTENAYTSCINRDVEHWKSDRGGTRKIKTSTQETDDW